MYTTVVVESFPPEAVAMVIVLHNDLRLSQSMNHMFFPEADRMHDSIYPHAPLIYKMNNIAWTALTLSSACSYILCVGVHRLDIYNTIVCFHNSVGSATQIVDNSKN